MSDPYDSLEDEYDKKNSSSDSLSECKDNAFDFFTGANKDFSSDSVGPFYLNRNVAEEKSYLNQDFPYRLPKINFSPVIENASKGWVAPTNLVVDNQILKEQGLQINNDGSFTKSPRPLADELPFITREYKNLQFQKKKTYKVSKKTPHVKIYKKNTFNFTKSPDNGISTNKKINPKRKGSSEKIRTSESSVSSRPEKKDEEHLINDNMTDSMKEMLLLNQTDTVIETPEGMGGLKKTKRVMNLLEDHKNSRQNKFSNARWQSQKRTVAEHKQNSFDRGSLMSQAQKKSAVSNIAIAKQQSDIVLNGFKPNLNYSERRHLKNGFNPLPLRLWDKKKPSDTSRSNFGDSVVERLSEVSSRVLSCENLPDEEEELFYRRFMEKDKSQKPIQRSSRSEGPSDFLKLKTSVETSSHKDPREVRQHSLRFKPISKSMSIDLPRQITNTIQSLRKYPHYCSADSSPNISKFELALKAKTYGYLANARNIFKMKTRCEGKLSAKEGDENLNSIKKASVNGRPGKNLTSKSTLPEILPERLPRAFGKTPKTKPPLCKTKNWEPSSENLRVFELPLVTDADSRDMKIQAEILKRITSCLNTPSGRSEGTFSSTFK